MTVSELKSLLASYPEDAPVVFPDLEWGTMRVVEKVKLEKGIFFRRAKASAVGVYDYAGEGQGVPVVLLEDA
jgi:hypothetical protein